MCRVASSACCRCHLCRSAHKTKVVSPIFCTNVRLEALLPPTGVFFSRMRISSPGTQKFPGNSLFQLFLKTSPISSHSRKKGVILGEGQKVSSPGGPCTALSTSIRFFQASGQSFSVISTPRSSSGRAECECLSYVIGFS